MKFGELKGRPIVSVGDATRLGSVDDLLLDLPHQRVVGLRVRLEGLFAGHRELPIEDIRSVGQDAVTIEGPDMLVDEKASPALEGSADLSAVRGSRIMTDTGTEIGTVADVEVELNGGSITGYVLAVSFAERLQHRERIVPASTVRSIGESIIVVADVPPSAQA